MYKNLNMKLGISILVVSENNCDKLENVQEVESILVISV